MNSTDSREPLVAVIGGGYGGTAVARALDEHARVVLVEPRDAFQHNVAALRAVVDPQWPERIFLPYDRLLARGRVLRDRAVRVEQGRVELASGEVLEPDYIVLATGSRYPFPAKSDHTETAEAVAAYHAARTRLEAARRVMLLGAGPVGLELAGEIKHVWPDKQVVLVDLADRILPGPLSDELRAELGRQLDELGVERVLGSPLTALPEVPTGVNESFRVTTEAGTVVEADLWFRCHGVVPVTDYLGESLAAARDERGYLKVSPRLELAGADTVYALGDIADIDLDKAGIAGRQAAVVAANIVARITGAGEQGEWTPAPPSIIVPLGPGGGSGQLLGQEGLAPRELVAKVKGGDLMVERYAEMFGVQ